MKKFVLLMIIAVFLLAGCTTGRQYDRSIQGGLIGGAAGYLLGRGPGALIGGALGAGAGSIIGTAEDDAAAASGRAPSYRRAPSASAGERSEYLRGRSNTLRDIQRERERRAYERGRRGW